MSSHLLGLTTLSFKPILTNVYVRTVKPLLYSTSPPFPRIIHQFLPQIPPPIESLKVLGSEIHHLLALDFDSFGSFFPQRGPCPPLPASSILTLPAWCPCLFCWWVVQKRVLISPFHGVWTPLQVVGIKSLAMVLISSSLTIQIAPTIAAFVARFITLKAYHIPIMSGLSTSNFPLYIHLSVILVLCHNCSYHLPWC